MRSDVEIRALRHPKLEAHRPPLPVPRVGPLGGDLESVDFDLDLTRDVLGSRFGSGLGRDLRAEADLVPVPSDDGHSAVGMRIDPNRAAARPDRLLPNVAKPLAV